MCVYARAQIKYNFHGYYIPTTFVIHNVELCVDVAFRVEIVEIAEIDNYNFLY